MHQLQLRFHCCKQEDKGKGNVDLHSTYTRNISKALRYSTHCQEISQFYMHTLHFIRKWNEPYLPLPSQPQLELIYRPRRDGRLSRPWCEVAPVETRTCNLPITSPAPYHTATSAARKEVHVQIYTAAPSPPYISYVAAIEC